MGIMIVLNIFILPYWHKSVNSNEYKSFFNINCGSVSCDHVNLCERCL